MNKTSKDRWIKCISQSGTVRGVAIQATQLAQELAERQKLGAHGAQALGEALVAGLLISSFCKDGERVNLNIRGDGFCSQALVDAYPDGTVRGYAIERTTPTECPTTPTEGLGPWGSGLLSVLRTKNTEGGPAGAGGTSAQNPPYIGTVPMITGFLAKDLTFYWLQSEQVPSAVGIAVNLDPQGKILSAGGFLLQAMPGATDQEIREIESQVNQLKDLSEQIALQESQEKELVELLAQFFQNTSLMILEEKGLKWVCHCSMEKVEKALVLVGVKELEAMLEQDGQASVNCDFCCTEYKADQEKLKELIKRAKG